MARRRNYKYRKPRRGAAKNEASKARSLQVAWRHATDRTETLPIAEARKIVADPGLCPYCGLRIPWREVSIDHIEPRSKGGSSDPSNLAFCDRRCNQAKSNLNGTQFRLLMDFLNAHPDIKDNVMSRLIAGSASWRRGRRRR